MANSEDPDGMAIFFFFFGGGGGGGEGGGEFNLDICIKKIWKIPYWF